MYARPRGCRSIRRVSDGGIYANICKTTFRATLRLAACSSASFTPAIPSIASPAERCWGRLCVGSTTGFNPFGVAFRFRADTISNAFADFPTLGVDSNAVYLSGNMFKGELNNLGPNLVSIPKADLLNSNITTRTYFGILDPNLYGWVLQPALCFDATTNGAILSIDGGWTAA